MNDQQIVNQYKSPVNLNTRSAFWEKYRTANMKPWHRWVFDNIMEFNPVDMVEIGCGTGELWKQNTSKIGNDRTILLSDRSEGMIKESLKGLSSFKNFKFEVFDASSIPHESMKYDCAIANHMLYHVPDIPVALGEIKRVLKPGGLFFAATNSRNHRRELIDILETGTSGKYENIGLSFDDVSGRKYLEKGFDIIDVRLYSDIVNVPDMDDFKNYIFSLPSVQNLGADEQEYLETHIEKVYDEKKSLKITFDSILFICRKM